MINEQRKSALYQFYLLKETISKGRSNRARFFLAAMHGYEFEQQQLTSRDPRKNTSKPEQDVSLPEQTNFAHVLETIITAIENDRRSTDVTQKEAQKIATAYKEIAVTAKILVTNANRFYATPYTSVVTWNEYVGNAGRQLIEASKKVLGITTDSNSEDSSCYINAQSDSSNKRRKVERSESPEKARSYFWLDEEGVSYMTPTLLAREQIDALLEKASAHDLTSIMQKFTLGTGSFVIEKPMLSKTLQNTTLDIAKTFDTALDKELLAQSALKDVLDVLPDYYVRLFSSFMNAMYHISNPGVKHETSCENVALSCVGLFQMMGVYEQARPFIKNDRDALARVASHWLENFGSTEITFKNALKSKPTPRRTN